MSEAAKKRSAETAKKRAETEEAKRVAEAEKKSKMMFRAVIDALYSRNLAKVAKYLDAGYLVDTANGFGQNVLTLAASCGFMGGLDLLLARGANVDHLTIYNSTALHGAAQMDYFDICLLLVAHGADPTVRMNDKAPNRLCHGKSPLDDYGCALDREEGEEYDDDVPLSLSAETKAARCAEIVAARDAYLLAVKRADNMDRRIPGIKVLAENRYRPLACRLLEVPPVDPAVPVPPLAPETTHERQLTDVFGSEGLVRLITSFV